METFNRMCKFVLHKKKIIVIKTSIRSAVSEMVIVEMCTLLSATVGGNTNTRIHTYVHKQSVNRINLLQSQRIWMMFVSICTEWKNSAMNFRWIGNWKIKIMTKKKRETWMKHKQRKTCTQINRKNFHKPGNWNIEFCWREIVRFESRSEKSWEWIKYGQIFLQLH